MADPRQVPTPHQERRDAPPGGAGPAHGAPGDPLRLCVTATVALLAWLLGPVALTVFALVGAAGYVRARRAGLLHSRCKLGDTRVVIAYLVVLALAGVAGTVAALTGTHVGI